MGISSTVLRVVGTIPGPIIFGTLIDRSCLLWVTPCDRPGACLVYDNWWMSRYLLGATLCWKFASFVFYNLAWILYKPPEGSEEYPVVKLDGEGRPTVEALGNGDAVAPPSGGLENPAFEP
ncbi:solute carrier organic anion transporter family member 4A1-like [Pollicipes pollicipes]|uniref:solute carrier organic anion transporter family member 4A1-like n=1 Tax=Pollicipes pollicipes TaxID=41117 RepID=UPI00188499A2|nr:solute carrier organic anion transporter family member 4A1-like [Pollicipes pollicipes]